MDWLPLGLLSELWHILARLPDMALSRRVERVASLIRRELSELFINGLRDERVHHGMITITDVDLSGDLQYCKIFVSIYGSIEDQKDVLIGLQSATGFLKGELARRLQMRRAPELVFQLDRGIEKGTNVLNLLGNLSSQRKEKEQINLDIE